MVRAVGFVQKSDAAYHSPLSKCPQVADENALPVQVSEKRVGKGFAPERKVLALVDRGERQGGEVGLGVGWKAVSRHRVKRELPRGVPSSRASGRRRR
jgi:hypothetical protein